MVNNKKSISLIACSLSILLLSSITLLATNLLIDKDLGNLDYERPLNRGKNYET